MKNIYSLLTPEQQGLFHSKKYKKDSKANFQGEECNYLYYLKSGHIKISSYLDNGKEIIYNDFRSGTVFGNNLLFSSEPYFRGDVICLEDSEILYLEKDKLLLLLQSNIKFLEGYITLQAEFSKQLNYQIKLLSISNSEERIVYFLNMNDNKFYGSVTDFSLNLLLTREATSRGLSKLIKEGKIIKEKSRIELRK